MPSVSQYMTAHPFTIDRRATLAEARRMMLANGIRHLPVTDGVTPVGVLSDRDLRIFEAAGSNAETTLVNAAMSEHPFVVTSDMALDEVVEIMGDKRYGSVLVIGRAGVEGIFTAVDACRALADVLRRAA